MEIFYNLQTNLLENNHKNNDQNEEEKGKKKRIIELKFLLKPIEIKGFNNKITEVVFERCELIGPPHNQTTKLTGETITLPCDLLLTSIGYKTLPISNEIPFNYQTNTIPHQNGRVIEINNTRSNDEKNNNIADNTDKATEQQGNVMKGLYVTGWCKRGPTGIIGTNINDSKETVSSILSDIQNNILEPISDEKSLEINKILLHCKDSYSSSPSSLSKIVTWKDVLKLEEYEKLAGSQKNPPKIREKCITVSDMLEKMK